MAIKELLALRRKAKKKQPYFIVKESNFVDRIKVRWRHPRGRHSKVRQMHVGRPVLPRPGFGSPKAVKGLHLSGLEIIVVHNSTELLALNAKTQGAVIAKIGQKKRIELLKLAQENKITVLNVKDVPKKVETIEKEFEERKALRKKKLVEASKKEEDKKKKEEEKKKKEEKEKKEKAEKEQAEAAGETAESETEAVSEEEKQKEIVEKTITKRR